MDENHRGKIKKAPAPEVVKYLINPAIKTDLERSYQTILDINKAHVLMLTEESIISADVRVHAENLCDGRPSDF